MNHNFKYPNHLTLEGFALIVREKISIDFDAQTFNKLNSSYDFLQKRLHSGEVIYGITTGFGALAHQYISPENTSQLQKKLIYHLCTGIGDSLPPDIIRGAFLHRLMVLSKGNSGVHPDSFRHLFALFALEGSPQVPESGTVGASGDLTPLAHLALVLMGEGKVKFKNKVIPSGDYYQSQGIEPWLPKGRDALAFVNGTSLMTAIAALNGVRFNTLLKLAGKIAFLFAEIMEAKGEAFHPEFGKVRPHQGLQKWTQWFFSQAQKSTRIQITTNHSHQKWENKGGPEPISGKMPQDAYTIRTLPQIFGAIQDTLDHHNQIVETELNSVTDNPLILPEAELIIQGGNFQGFSVGMVSDHLKVGIINLAVLLERQMARLHDPSLNKGLPAYLVHDQLGLNSGFMGAQVTASALVAEIRGLGIPISTQSIPTNNNNQDIVSMGTIAARQTYQCLELLSSLLAITTLSFVEAAELSSGKDFSLSSNDLITKIREEIPSLKEDRPLAEDIARVKSKLLNL